MTLQGATSITFGELKAELTKLALEKERKPPADLIAMQIQIISSYLKKEKGIEEPTLEDVLNVIRDAPDDLQIACLTSVAGLSAWDTATIVGAKWLTKLVVDELKARGIEYTLLYGDQATRSQLFQALLTKRGYVKWLGHGNADIITGQNGATVLWTGDTEGCSKLKQAEVKVFSALSCITAAGLGPWLVSQGCVKAYYGYAQEFVFLVGNDAVEKPFFDSDTAFDRALFDKEPSGTAFERAIERWNYYVNNPNTSEWMRPYLVHDRDCAKLLGDRSINPFEGVPPSPPPGGQRIDLQAYGNDRLERYVTVTLDNTKIVDRARTTLPFSLIYDVQLEEGEHKLIFDVYNPPEIMKWVVIFRLNGKLIDVKEAWGNNPATFTFRVGEAPPPPPSCNEWKGSFKAETKSEGEAAGYMILGRFKIPITLKFQGKSYTEGEFEAEGT
ncbi:MAG: hypothetical protein QW365_08890 [Candidatus Nezhaarchaeales archaeon]